MRNTWGILEQGREFPDDRLMKRNRLKLEIVESFPDQERWLLPTSFGNTIRAFEVYPRVMYGIDSIIGWNRLLGVIPKEYGDLYNDAKTSGGFLGKCSFLVL